MQTLQRYEATAGIRAQDKDDDFDAMYDQTDAALQAADFASLPAVFFDAQMHQLSGQRGLSIEFRRRQSLPWNLGTTSETYWRFSPYRNLRKRFIVEEVGERSLNLGCSSVSLQRVSVLHTDPQRCR